MNSPDPDGPDRQSPTGPGKPTYPGELDPQLAAWHDYTANGGHVIDVVLDFGNNLSDPPVLRELKDKENRCYLPVKTVLRLVQEGKVRQVNGYVVCQWDFDPWTGVVTPEEDTEL